MASASEIAVGIAAVSAVASAVSAWSSSRAVTLSHKPFLVAVPRRELDAKDYARNVGAVGIQLRNDGPGLAVSIRLFARAVGHPEIADQVIGVRPIAPGQTREYAIPFGLVDGRPEGQRGPADPAAGPIMDVPPFLIEIEFGDIAGALWAVKYPDFDAPRSGTRRVRSGRFDFWRTPAGNW